jgi:hypothetical protein
MGVTVRVPEICETIFHAICLVDGTMAAWMSGTVMALPMIAARTTPRFKKEGIINF